MAKKAKDFVLIYLAEHARGRKNAVSAPFIACEYRAQVDQRYDDYDGARIRDVITDLIEEGFDILASSRGFFMPSDGADGEREYDDYIETLEARRRGLSRRISAVKRNRQRFNPSGEQATLELSLTVS